MPASRRLSRSAASVVALGAALLLAGCGVTPAPTPTAAPSTQSPSPTPTETADAELSAVVVAADGFELRAGDVTLDSLAFDADPVSIVDAVTAAFGEEPTITEQPGDCCHFGPSTWYEWGGFRVAVAVEGVPAGQNPPVSVVLSAPAVGAVELRTTEGYQVGDDCFAIAEQEGAALTWSSDTVCDIGVDFGISHGAPEVDGYPNANAVELIGEPNVSRIVAPANLGVGRV